MLNVQKPILEAGLSANPVAIDDGCPSGAALREARRHRGLSQSDLADLLGISQSRVSAWERGYDHVPMRLRHQLIDIMANKSGVLDPLIRKLIRSDPTLAVNLPTTTDGFPDFQYVHVATYPNVDFLRPLGGYYGHCISEFFDLGWYMHGHGGQSLRDKLMFDVEREIITAEKYGHEHIYRVRSHHMFLDFDGHQELVLARHTFQSKPTFEPAKIHDSLFIDELD